MLNQYLNQLQQTENLAKLGLNDNPSSFPYKRFGQVWIRADKSLNQIYDSIKYSELSFFPSFDYKVWGIWILSILKFKKSPYEISKLLGIGLNWYFKKKYCYPLQADVIYYRKHAIVMVYTSENRNKVVKLALSKFGKTFMTSALASQQLARAIESDAIFIPKVLMEFHNEELDFSVEEYFQGKGQSFEDTKVLANNYKKAFQFLLKFYLNNPIELLHLSENPFLGHSIVEDFIMNQEKGKEVLSIFKKLLMENKKMILCRIHGDLNHNNLLHDEDNKVCIIDWGKSKHHFLARDLDNSSYDTQEVYKEFIHKTGINSSEIYTYREQLFLARFIEMNRSIYNKSRSKRKINPNHLSAWTKQQNLQLVKMGEGL